MLRTGLGTLAILLGAGAAHAQSGEIRPARPWVEQTAYGPALNFDILLTNDTAGPLEISGLEVTFVGADGREVITRRLDGNGSAPSIRTVPDRSIEPGARRLVFNPFEHAPPGSDVGAVHVHVILDGDDDSSRTVDMEAPVRRASDAELLSPVAGAVLVWDGHDHLSHHRRWDYALPFLQGLGFDSNAMRYSYDFVPVGPDGQTHAGDGDRNEDWVGFGQAVRAPGPGVVVQVRDDRPDDRSFDPTELADDINLVFGNVVVIDHGDGTFSMLGHIRQGSATVSPGDRVVAGQTVAAIGASGSSLFPHLHYQRVDAADMRGEGVPSRFRDLTLSDGRVPAFGHVDSGDLFVAH